MNPEVNFTFALAVRRDCIYIAAVPDTMPRYEPYTRLYHYDARRAQPWSFHDVNFWTGALAKFRERSDEEIWTLCALAECGMVELAARGSAMQETIADAGLYRPGATGYGYLMGLGNIAGRLYACGDAGQVYRRLGPDHWVHMDAGLLQAPDVKNSLLLWSIQGCAEDDIYVAGTFAGASGREGRLIHWNGQRWRFLDLPVIGGLVAMCMESTQRVWVAGQKGTLLMGNQEQGFESLLMPDDSLHFRSLTWHQGALYLGSNLGLFRYDEESRSVNQVTTGLSPELSDISTVDYADGVLWVVGAKDIAYFDGATWTRLQHPHNTGPFDPRQRINSPE